MNRRGLLTLLFVCTAILCSTVIRFSYQELNAIPSGDEGQYQDVARSVASGDGWRKESLIATAPDGHVSAAEILPFYTGSLALVHRLFGWHERSAYFLNLFFAALLTLVSYAAVRRLTGSETVALLSAFLVAFDPVVTKMSSLATKDVSFAFAFVLLVLAMPVRAPARRIPAMIITLAILILSRKNGYWFVPPLLLWYGVDLSRPLSTRLKEAGMVFAGAAICVLPWFLLVRSDAGGELADIAAFASGSLSAPIPTLTINWLHAAESSLRALLTSPFAAAALCWVPFVFVMRRISRFDLFAGSAMAVFLAILSLRNFQDTTTDFYYLTFHLLLLWYGAEGFVAVVDKCVFGTTARRSIYAVAVCLLLFVIADDVRNHMHPLLRAKYDERSSAQRQQKLVDILNTLPASVIACSSELQQQQYLIDPRMKALPLFAEGFCRDSLSAAGVTHVIIGFDNLLETDFVRVRPWLRKYWSVVDGDSLTLQTPLTWLQEERRMRSCRLYRIVADTISPVKPAEPISNQ